MKECITAFATGNMDIEKDWDRYINELKNIDRCFVFEDADGIKEIVKKAETDPTLSNWEKMRIINECQSALIDLYF